MPCVDHLDCIGTPRIRPKKQFRNASTLFIFVSIITTGKPAFLAPPCKPAFLSPPCKPVSKGGADRYLERRLGTRPQHIRSLDSLKLSRVFINSTHPPRMSAVDSDVDSGSLQKREKALGISVLLTVPLAWGTYVPVVRYLYEIKPPVPGFVFSAGYYSLASVTLLALVALQNTEHVEAKSAEQPLDDNDEKKEDRSGEFPSLGGLELGTYLFLGNGLQILGLKTVPSDRAGFLVQLTTVMVPLVQAGFAGNLLAIPIRTWCACAIAFSGVVVMGIDGKESVTGESALSTVTEALHSFSSGDFLIVLSAFVYTLHVVRLGRYAKETTPLKLAASKATAEAFLSVALVVGLISVGASFAGDGGFISYASETGKEITIFFESITDGITSGSMPPSVLIPATGAVLWTGWVTCAYTIYAQSFGQQRVDPTEANLVYSVQPLFTALFAWGLLGETLGPAGCVGGALIAFAVYMVADEQYEGTQDGTRGIAVTPKDKTTSVVDADCADLLTEPCEVVVRE